MGNNKKKTEIPTSHQVNRNGDKPDSEAQLMDIFLNPNFDQLTGLTRAALDQVRPMSFTRVFAEEFIRLFKLSKDSQEEYSKNWELWHSNKEVIPEVGQRIMPDKDFNEERWLERIKRIRKTKSTESVFEEKKEKEIFKLFPDGFKPVVEDLKTDKKFKIPTLGDMIGVKFIYQYDLRRRSTTPEWTIEYMNLLGRAFEMRQPEDENKNPKVYRDQ